MVNENNDLKAAAAASAVAAVQEGIKRVPKERSEFRALLVSNPNYFGNLRVSPFPAVINIQGNTTYEELGCVGFHPQLERLDAVVYVKQPYGYGGNVCSAGTPEYVRFYLSYDNGATWLDQGLASVQSYDIPEGTVGVKRLEYAVSVPCSPPRKFCKYSNVLLARAILSWNDPPPADMPDYVPVWGDIHNTHIQVDPWKLPRLIDIFEIAKVKVPLDLAEILDLDQPLPTIQPKTLQLAELHALYKGKGVEPHRYALAEVKKLVASPELTTAFKTPGFKSPFVELDIDLAAIVGKLAPVDGSTLYEELECVGFNPVASELSAVIRLKKPNGYSGNPCTTGSREYVTFWADADANGSFETCLGTASVQVYDVASVPAAGLEYAVYLPVDFSALRRPCTQGARVVPIRAILSWNDIPPCWNPNHVPVWGNREETLIQIPAGPSVVPGDYTPFLYDVSGAAVCSIDQSTGLAGSFDRPFGGTLTITGEIPAALALTTPDTLKYKVYVRQLPGGPWQPLTNSFGITVHEGTGIGTAVSHSITQSIDGAGWYTYREYGAPVTGSWRRVSSPNRLLAAWHTAQPMTGLWEIRVEALDTVTSTVYLAGVTTCSDSSTRQNVKVRLDEIVPVPSITISEYSFDGVNWTPALPCGTFEVGMRLRGTYSVADEHFGSLSITVEPASAAHGATVSPSSRVYPVVSSAGESGTWTLDTAGMDPCGYVIRMDVRDRTIVSGGSGWHDYDTVGFCLEAPDTN
jgi:hypothetical protein